MSSPLINRWGLNTFWHNMWFSDYNYASNYNQDRIFTTLIKTYLFYGLRLPYNLFANAYWYQRSYYKLSVATYYRWITRKGAQFGELIRYSLRNEADCLFPMKLWILRYDQWLVINQYWFHPLKTKTPVRSLMENRHTDTFHFLRHSNLNALKRLKKLTSIAFLRTYTKTNYYTF